MSKQEHPLMQLVKQHGIDAAVEALADLQRAKDLGRELEARDARLRLVTAAPSAVGDALFSVARFQANTLGELIKLHRNQAEKLHDSLRQGLGLGAPSEPRTLTFDGTIGTSVQRHFTVSNPTKTTVTVTFTLSEFATDDGARASAPVLSVFTPPTASLAPAASLKSALAITIPQSSSGHALRADIRVWMGNAVGLTIPIRVVCR